MGIKIIYHACAITGNGKCLAVVKEHILCIIMSGLYDKVDTIHVNIVGDLPMIDVLRTQFEKSGPKFQVTVQQPNGYGFERDTLMNAFQYIEPNDMILFLHSKGITRTCFPESSYVDDWTMCMNYFLIKRHEECLQLLQSGKAQVVGINYEPNPRPHFSGNFWWCRGDYFLTLPKVIGTDKYAVELDFLFVNNPSYVCMHHSHTHHYQKQYPFTNYI